MEMLSDRIVLAIWRDRGEKKAGEKKINAEGTEEEQRTRRIF
jgi:hypothetical protein